MKKALLLPLALAVIPVTVDAQIPDLEEVRARVEQGDPTARFDLGYMYDLGEGVPENDAEATRWYRLAAEQGDAYAQTGLGFLYALGEGVPEDYVLAYMWLNLAAAQGIVHARGGRSRRALGPFQAS